jgi:divalent metal cation (Fe/Co/Zn/Cd) transporter
LLNLGLRGVVTAGGEGIVRAIHAGHAQGQAAAAAIRLPSWPALILAGVSIASKEWLFQVTRKVGEALNSQIIIANAWHHRSDAFSSVLSFGSIALAMTLPQFVFVDSAAGIFVAGMICLTGLDVLIESVKELVDTSDDSVAEDAKSAIMQVQGVLGVKSLRSRSVGSGKMLVDVTIQTDKMMSFSAAQSIAEKAKWKLMTAMPSVMDVSVRTSTIDEDGVPFCPLLSEGQVSPVVAEENVRRAIAEAQAAGASPALAPLVAVTRCTIYYMQTALLHADCFVRLDPRVSVEQASGLADELSKQVVASKAVDSCSVFVDVGSAEIARPAVAPTAGGGGEGQPLVSNPGLFVVAPPRR